MVKARWFLLAAVLLIGIVFIVGFPGGSKFATVGGVGLKASELSKKVDKLEAAYLTQYTPEQLGDNFRSQAELYVAQNMILLQLVKADNKAKGWNREEPQAMVELEEEKNMQSAEEYALFMEGRGMTEKEYRELVSHQYNVFKDLTVTEEEVKAFYLNSLTDTNYASLLAETVTVRHILVETEDEAKDVIRRLKAGEDFTALVQEKSIDPGSQSTGGVYADVARGYMVKAFEDAAFSLKKGELSEPIKTDYGFHIIEKMEHKQAATEADFETHREMMQTEALESLKNTTYNNYVQNLMDTGNIEYAKGYERLDPNAEIDPNVG